MSGNNFLAAASRLIKFHGTLCTYNSIQVGAYDVEASAVTIVKTPYSLKLYPKQIIASSNNFPDLIGKEALMFYLANDSLSFAPKLNDEITYLSYQYKVQSYQQTVANGATVLYRIIAVRG